MSTTTPPSPGALSFQAPATPTITATLPAQRRARWSASLLALARHHAARIRDRRLARQRWALNPASTLIANGGPTVIVRPASEPHHWEVVIATGTDSIQLSVEVNGCALFAGSAPPPRATTPARRAGQPPAATSPTATSQGA
jgi:hypothetical protein